MKTTLWYKTFLVVLMVVTRLECSSMDVVPLHQQGELDESVIVVPKLTALAFCVVAYGSVHPEDIEIYKTDLFNKCFEFALTGNCYAAAVIDHIKQNEPNAVSKIMRRLSAPLNFNYIISESENLKIFQKLFSWGLTSIMHILAPEDLEAVNDVVQGEYDLLQNLGVPKEVLSCKALHTAARLGRCRVARLLIGQIPVDLGIGNGPTPLADASSVAMARLFLDYHANPNAVSHGRSVLFEQLKRPAIVELLLSVGAQLTDQDKIQISGSPGIPIESKRLLLAAGQIESISQENDAVLRERQELALQALLDL